MVIGIDKFREYFKDFPDSYVIIGGTACDIIIGAAGLTPRATKTSHYLDYQSANT